MKTFSKFLVGTPLSLAALLSAGCPSDPVVTPDSGPTVMEDTGTMTMRDTGTPREDSGRDAGPVTELATCAAPRTITLAAGAAMTVTGSTAGGAPGPLETECGNGSAEATAPQEVLAIQIPGTAPALLSFEMTAATAATFDTVVEVRTTCTDQGQCFDDLDATTTRSGGSVRVMGGETVFLVVSGFADGMFMGTPTMGSGAYALELQVEPLIDLATCAAPRTVALVAGTPSVIMGDLSRGVPGPLDLGEDCFGGPEVPAADRLAQDVVAVTIPGTGMVNVSFDTRTGTGEETDTFVQVRTTCATIPGPLHTCFDDTDEDVRSSGAFVAAGGSTVFLVVSSAPSSTYELTVQTEGANAAPTLTAGTAVRIGSERFRINLTGGDADSNATGYYLELLNAAGTPISFSETETFVGPVAVGFDEAPTTATFTNQASVLVGSARIPAFGRAVSVRVSVVDRFGLLSAPLTIAIADVGGLGQPCDGTECAGALMCTAAVCAATPATTAACAAATAVTLTAPTATTPSVSAQSVMLAAGAGAVAGSCGVDSMGGGTERLFNVIVPAGTFDLIVTTNVAATTATVDTAAYIRRTCVDDTSELSCNDDYDGAPMGTDFRSTAIAQGVGAGTYTVAIDTFEALEAATTVGAEFRLRSVLAAGAACDPMGVMNRCSTAACPASGAAVCPAAPPAG